MKKSSTGVYRSCASLAVLSVLLLTNLHAQSTTQTVQGLVSDSTGAIIAGAKVTLTNQATNVSQTITTNATGNYTFTLVLVGDYTIRCEMQGFKTEVVRNQRVETAAQVRHDFTLDLGSVTESIEVSASAVLLQTENATTGGVIENRRIVELPLNGRNMQSLAVLVPGVQYGIRTGKSDGSTGFPISGQGFGCNCLSPNAILRLELSTESTTTSTFWPFFRMS